MPVANADISRSEVRTDLPLFTFREAAKYLGMPERTLHSWARPTGGHKLSDPAADAPLITAWPSRGWQASIPFVGFSEAFVLSAFRNAGVPMQRIRPAVAILRRDIGIDHALASRRLYTDGAEVLIDNADAIRDVLELTVVRNNQKQFSVLVRDYLKRIQYGRDGYAESLTLPGYGKTTVVVDPLRAFGQPFLAQGGARVEDIVDRFHAGDLIADLAVDFLASPSDIEEVIRGATRETASA